MTKSWQNFDQILTKSWPNLYQNLTKAYQNLTKTWPICYQILTKSWPKLDQNLTKMWPNLTKTWPKLDQDVTKQNLTKTWPKLSALSSAHHLSDHRTALQVNSLLLLWFLTTDQNLLKSAAWGLLKWHSLLIDHKYSYFLLTSSIFFHAQFSSFSVVVPWAKCWNRWGAWFRNVKALTNQTRFARPGGSTSISQITSRGHLALSFSSVRFRN